MSSVEQSHHAAPNPSAFDFEQVFLPHLGAAYNFARWILHNDQDAEDAVQEACLRAHKAMGRFRGGDGKAWLMTIVRNVCYTMLKKTKGHETQEAFDEEIHQPATEAERRQEFQKKANAETLHAALERLPHDFREVIVLHDLEGFAYKEIADVVGIPIGTVMSRLARSRTRLREEIIAGQSKEIS